MFVLLKFQPFDSLKIADVCDNNLKFLTNICDPNGLVCALVEVLQNRLDPVWIEGTISLF